MDAAPGCPGHPQAQLLRRRRCTEQRGAVQSNEALQNTAPTAPGGSGIDEYLSRQCKQGVDGCGELLFRTLSMRCQHGGEAVMHGGRPVGESALGDALAGTAAGTLRARSTDRWRLDPARRPRPRCAWHRSAAAAVGSSHGLRRRRLGGLLSLRRCTSRVHCSCGRRRGSGGGGGHTRGADADGSQIAEREAQAGSTLPHRAPVGGRQGSAGMLSGHVREKATELHVPAVPAVGIVRAATEGTREAACCTPQAT